MAISKLTPVPVFRQCWLSSGCRGSSCSFYLFADLVYRVYDGTRGSQVFGLCLASPMRHTILAEDTSAYRAGKEFYFLSAK